MAFGDDYTRSMVKLVIELSFSRLTALHAVERLAQKHRAAGFRDHPWTHLPWWVVANVLRVTALEVRDPVLLFILMEADDPPGNRRPRACISLHIGPLRRVSVTSLETAWVFRPESSPPHPSPHRQRNE